MIKFIWCCHIQTLYLFALEFFFFFFFSLPIKCFTFVIKFVFLRSDYLVIYFNRTLGSMLIEMYKKNIILCFVSFC